MGLFSKKGSRIQWVTLESEEQLNALYQQSEKVKILFFKHSTRCSISYMARKRLESNWDMSDEIIIPVYLDLIQFRSLSNQLAADLGVRHESPQVLLVENAKCIYTASHNGISVKAINENI